ncbi:hypothetical protein CDD83_1680 [Cordyceps sp. RAO-2017]|nr:hypothetical protein CDD83_1680 [Cordyceps sp. RAO-2017]
MASGKDDDLLPITQPTCTARDRDGDQCHGIPHIPCPQCLLVAYCDGVCRERDWPSHKADCNKNIERELQSFFDRAKDSGEDDDAAKVPHTFWARCPATDVLQLDKNEGRYFDDELHLLFTGESGLRHFIYTLAKLPDTASPRLFVSIDEVGPRRLARTFFVLSLLLARDHDAILNAEAAVHIWYSATMPRALHRHLKSVVAGGLGRDLDAIVGKHGAASRERHRAHWSVADVSVDVELRRSEWADIRTLLNPTHKYGIDEGKLLRYADTCNNVEPPRRYLARMTRARALGRIRWQADGLLLPYGHPRDDFDMLNPIFFQDDQQFPPGAAAEPMSEWPIELLDYAECPAPNDAYGKMFYYVRDLFVQFQRRLVKTTLSLRLSCETTLAIKSEDRVPSFDRPFDRIEVGDNWELHPLYTLVTMSRLLRHQDENPFATLLAIDCESVTHDMESVQKDLDAEFADLHRPTNTALDELAAPVPDLGKADARELTRRRLGLVLWRNWDKFSNRYLGSADHFAFAAFVKPGEDKDKQQSIIQSGFLGLQLREKHLITRRWPTRLVHSKKDKPSLRDFNRHIAWPDVTPKRWLEWKRVGDSTDDELETWASIAVSMRYRKFEEALLSMAKDKQDDEGGDGDGDKGPDTVKGAASDTTEWADSIDGQDRGMKALTTGPKGDEGKGPEAGDKDKGEAGKKQKAKKAKGKKK